METWKRFAIGLLVPVLVLGGCKEKRKSGVIYHTPGEYKVPEQPAIKSLAIREGTDLGNFEYGPEAHNYPNALGGGHTEYFGNITFRFTKPVYATEVQLRYVGDGEGVESVWIKSQSQTFNSKPFHTRQLSLVPDSYHTCPCGYIVKGKIGGLTQNFKIDDYLKELGIRFKISDGEKKPAMEFSLEGEFRTE